MITFGLDLNLIPGKVLPRLNVSQYDKGQTVSVSLWNGDVPYSIPAGCTAQVVGTKADKTGFMYECTIENGQPSFVITDQMTIFPGEVTLEVIIMDADNRIGTVNFILDVERAALADDTQISESDLPIIQQLPEIRAEVEAAAALAEAWAVGPGTQQEPSATNNAYYWAMQAASAAGGGLQPSVVQELPTQNISTSTIYFVPSSDPSASNYYDEYINLDGTSQGWELIGTTAIDLTDYYTKGEVDALLATINGNVTTLDTQLKACSGQAAPYSTTKNYVPTDMVYYNDMLYQCIGAHTGAWDDLYFEPVDLSLLQTRYNNLNTRLTTRDIVYTPVSGWNPNVVESKVSANNLTLALTFNGIGIITQDTNRPIKIGTLAMKPYVLTPINCYNMATATVANDIAAWVDTNGDVYWEHYSSGTKTIDIIGSFLVH